MFQKITDYRELVIDSHREYVTDVQYDEIFFKNNSLTN